MKQISGNTILFAAGGTGGHIIPALNIARAIGSRARVIFIGSQRGLEHKMVKEAGFEIVETPIAALPRRIGLSAITFPVKLLYSVAKAISVIKKNNVRAVVGTGGYASGPAVLAAPIAGVPLILQEQNSIPGITTRVASLWAKRIFLSFPGSETHLIRSKNTILVGNPVLIPDEIPSRDNAKSRFAMRRDIPLVLITGGSQGAASINRTVLKLAKRAEKLPFAILWQTGEKNFDEIASLIKPLKGRLRILPFIDPMWEAIVAADLVVARAGALSLAEMAAFGKPSLLVPFPFAAADHQTKNAKAIEKAGAAVVIRDDEMTAEILENTILKIIGNKEKLSQMAKAAKKLGQPEALSVIADEIIRIAGGEK